MTRVRGSTFVLATLALAAIVVGGCQQKGPEGGGGSATSVMSSGDEVCLEVAPVGACGPIMSQQVIVATVKDKSGTPLAGKRVEWMIAPGEPGVIVAADGRNGRNHKIDNSYAVTHTASMNHTIHAAPPVTSPFPRGRRTWCSPRRTRG